MPLRPPETRASLLSRLQSAEDVAAWNDFVDIYVPAITVVGRRFGLQHADTENLIQEVLLAVSNGLEKWLQRSDRGRFRAWLLRVAHNQAIDLISRRATRAEDGLAFSHIQLGDLPDRRSEFSEMCDIEYQRAAFQWAALRVRETVESQVWQAFWMTQIEGLSVTSASSQLAMRAGSVYAARSRVMQKIKRLVQEFKDK